MSRKKHSSRILNIAAAFSSRESGFLLALLGVIVQAFHTYFITYSLSSFDGYWKTFQACLVAFFISGALLFFTLKSASGEDIKSKRYRKTVNMFAMLETFINLFYWGNHLLIDKWPNPDYGWFIIAIPFSFVLPLTLKAYSSEVRVDDFSDDDEQSSDNNENDNQIIEDNQQEQEPEPPLDFHLKSDMIESERILEIPKIIIEKDVISDELEKEQQIEPSVIQSEKPTPPSEHTYPQQLTIKEPTIDEVIEYGKIEEPIISPIINESSGEITGDAIQFAHEHTLNDQPIDISSEQLDVDDLHKESILQQIESANKVTEVISEPIDTTEILDYNLKSEEPKELKGPSVLDYQTNTEDVKPTNLSPIAQPTDKTVNGVRQGSVNYFPNSNNIKKEKSAEEIYDYNKQ